MSSNVDLSSPLAGIPPSLPNLASSSDLAASLDSYGEDIAGWINDLLDNQHLPRTVDGAAVDLTALDKHVQLVATRLDVASQDTSSQLEQSIDDISRTIPRLTYDLQFMRESALSLQEALQNIEKSRLPPPNPPAASTDTDKMSTKQVLDRLHYLDTVKGSLEKTYSVLREAEAWSSLDSEITALLASQSYAPAASRLSEAARSLALFSNTPEYESRRALMISLQNQLEAALSSALVAAINKRDVAACKGYHDIFTDIQREVEFRNYYFGNRRKGLVDLWSNAHLEDCEGEDVASVDGQELPKKQPFIALLKQFFADFNALLTEEQSYTVSIFPDPQQTLSAFVQSTIDALNPSFSQRLSSMSEHHGPLSLPQVIQAFKSTEEFAVSTSKILENAAYSARTGTAGDDKSHTAGAKSLSRRASRRISLSRRLGPARSGSISGPQGLGDPIGGTGAWEQALFEPFMDFQSEYGVLEKRFMDEGLTKIISSAPTLADGAKVLRERSAAVFDMAEETLERCFNLTHGYGALGLVQSFDYAFSEMLHRTKTQVLSGKYAAPQQASKDYQDGDYTQEDWDAFQHSLHVLETCRAMSDRLKAVDSKIKASLLQFAGIVQLTRIDPTGLFIHGTTKGEVQLLSQSTLNSAELHAFLEGLIQESQNSNVSALGSSVGSFLAPPTTTPQSEVTTPGAQTVASQPVLKGAQSAIGVFTKATQRYVQNIILSPLHAQLATYASLSWTSQQRSKPKAGAAYDMSIPTFSLSPTPTIQRVAEGLLNLPRMFEIHADDDALGFSIETLPFVNAESLRKAILGMTEDETAQLQPEISPRLERRRLSSGSTSSNPKAHINIPPPQPLVLTPEMVSSTWLSSLALSLLSHLTSNILPSVRTLSQDGAAQLGSDLSYLSNIVRAMNVEWDDLEKWKELAEMSDDEGLKKLKDAASGGNGDESDTVLKLCRCVERSSGGGAVGIPNVEVDATGSVLVHMMYQASPPRRWNTRGSSNYRHRIWQAFWRVFNESRERAGLIRPLGQPAEPMSEVQSSHSTYGGTYQERIPNSSRRAMRVNYYETNDELPKIVESAREGWMEVAKAVAIVCALLAGVEAQSIQIIGNPPSSSADSAKLRAVRSLNYISLLFNISAVVGTFFMLDILTELPFRVYKYGDNQEGERPTRHSISAMLKEFGADRRWSVAKGFTQICAILGMLTAVIQASCLL
ncbi:hypothetical protein FRB90_008999 [Tulasnella sp. 427]|nr:hypothetical protein FRB90_008999 [Tulasnella sp. 427]